MANGGVGPDRFRLTAGNDAAIDQHGQAIGEREHRLHVVLDQKDGHAALELAEHLHHARGLFRPHAGHRLVEQQKPRPGRERHGDFKLPVLAVAELVDAHARRAP